MHGVPRGPTRSVHRGDHGPSIELRNGSNSEVPSSFCCSEGSSVSWQMARITRISRSRRPWGRGDVLCMEPGESHAGRDRQVGLVNEGDSQTKNIYADEYAAGVIVPEKRPN